MTDKRAELMLTLEAPSTADRVRRTGAAFSALLKKLGVAEEHATVVVSNLLMKATLRAQTDASDAVIRDVADIAKFPAKAKERVHGFEIAQAVVGLGRAFAEEGPALILGHRKPIPIDAHRIKRLENISRQIGMGGEDLAGLRGTSELRTHVLRVGRQSETSAMKARVILRGHPQDVTVGEGALDATIAAMRAGGLHRLQIRARWVPVGNGIFETVPSSIVVLGAKPVKSVSGAEFLKQMPPISQESFDDFMEAVRDARSDQDD